MGEGWKGREDAWGNAFHLLLRCADNCGFENVESMLDAATFDVSCPGICSGCKTIVDNVEPDMRSSACHECMANGLGEEVAGTVNSVLVLAELV